VVSAKTPAELPWAKLGVQIVIESTGLFTSAAKDARKSSYGHIKAGAKKVIISPRRRRGHHDSSWASNDDKYDTAKHQLISNAPAPRTVSRRL